MAALEIDQFLVQSCVIIPWGSAHAMKCTFARIATCGNILRNSFKLSLGEVKSNNYGVRPDYSIEQRNIRKKLVQFGKELESKVKAKWTVKSWRYLFVTFSPGKRKFFEIDSVSKEPVTQDESVIPPKLLVLKQRGPANQQPPNPSPPNPRPSNQQPPILQPTRVVASKFQSAAFSAPRRQNKGHRIVTQYFQMI